MKPRRRPHRGDYVSNGKQSGPRIGVEEGPVFGVATGLSR
jgi:hypothetical protein